MIFLGKKENEEIIFPTIFVWEITSPILSHSKKELFNLFGVHLSFLFLIFPCSFLFSCHPFIILHSQFKKKLQLDISISIKLLLADILFYPYNKSEHFKNHERVMYFTFEEVKHQWLSVAFKGWFKKRLMTLKKFVLFFLHFPFDTNKSKCLNLC